MSNLWKVEIEDEHSSFGGTVCNTFDCEATAMYWLKNHLKDQVRNHLGICIFRSRETIESWCSELDQDPIAAIEEYESLVQNHYSSWEYGGRFYISFGPSRVLTMADLTSPH